MLIGLDGQTKDMYLDKKGCGEKVGYPTGDDFFIKSPDIIQSIVTPCLIENLENLIVAGELTGQVYFYGLDLPLYLPQNRFFAFSGFYEQLSLDHFVYFEKNRPEPREKLSFIQKNLVRLWNIYKPGNFGVCCNIVDNDKITTTIALLSRLKEPERILNLIDACAHEETHAIIKLGCLDQLKERIQNDMGIDINFQGLNNEQIAHIGSVYAFKKRVPQLKRSDWVIQKRTGLAKKRRYNHTDALNFALNLFF